MLKDKLRALRVGDTVYLENLDPRRRNQLTGEINRRRQLGEEPLYTEDMFKPFVEEGTVKSHGRTYITVMQGKYREYQFNYDTGRQKTEYAPDYNIHASREEAEESVRTPYLFFGIKTELSKYPAYGSWNNAAMPPAKVELLADVLGVSYEWVKPQNPPCYNPEKDNPYPLCQGRGMTACAHCGIWKDYDPGEDEARATQIYAKENKPFPQFKNFTPKCDLWGSLIENLPTDGDARSLGFWADGEMILCKSEQEAEAVANFITALGYDYVKTGYYDPKEDAKDVCEDAYTGWYYVDID